MVNQVIEHFLFHENAASDLHWLLVSPPLLDSQLLNDALGRDAALGRKWLALLAAREGGLSGLPYDWTRAQKRFRLGLYAEQLLAAALTALPSYTLLAQQLAVHGNKRTLGEYDFLLNTPGGYTQHIELAVKVYLMVGDLAAGAGLRDALPLKVRVLKRQLQLSATPEGRAALPPDCAEVQPVAWVRGWIFYECDTAVAMPVALSADHLRGWWQCWGKPMPRRRPDSVWRLLPRQDWLAPRLAGVDCLLFNDLQRVLEDYFQQHDMPHMLAEYAPLAEGGAELARGMVVSASWPDPLALATLKGRVEAAGGYD